MTQYRFVHLSDIHFGQERYGDKPVHDDVRVELLRDCAQLRKLYGNANGVLVCGDVAFSGKVDQYKSAGEWLDKLTDAVGCLGTAVLVVPGNHDVDLSQIGAVSQIVYEKIRSAPLADLNDLLGEQETTSILLPKFNCIPRFCRKIWMWFSLTYGSCVGKKLAARETE